MIWEGYNKWPGSSQRQDIRPLTQLSFIYRPFLKCTGYTSVSDLCQFMGRQHKYHE